MEVIIIIIANIVRVDEAPRRDIGDELKDATSFDVAKILEYLTQQNVHEVTE